MPLPLPIVPSFKTGAPGSVTTAPVNTITPTAVIAGTTTINTAPVVVVAPTAATVAATAAAVTTALTAVSGPSFALSGANGTAVSGVSVPRGTAQPAAVIEWDEAQHAWIEGTVGSTQLVAGVPSATAAGYLRWNGTSFVAGASALDTVNQPVGTGANPTFGTVTLMQLAASNGTLLVPPSAAGASGYVLTTDGTGVTRWAVSAAASGTGAAIASADTQSGIAASTTALSARAGGVAVWTATAAGTRFLQPVTGLRTAVTQFATSTFTVGDTDAVCIYTGAAVPVALTLPAITAGVSRTVVVENSIAGATLTVAPAVGNTIDRTTTALVLDVTGNTTVLMSDGTSNWICI